MDIAGKKVAYITLGCKLNFSETSTIKHSLEHAGTKTVSEKEEADIFVINTCSVTDMAEKKGRQLIRKSSTITQVPILLWWDVMHNSGRKKSWLLTVSILF